MRLISLNIKNFRVIKHAALELPDRVIGIVGPNGAGKSSIIEAIAWALYGNQAARSGREEIRSCFAGVSETCEVDLSFALNDEKYRVIRRLAGRTERAEVELYRGDSSESVGVSDTKDYISQLLGLDWKGFLTSFLARQQELNALSDLQPSKRKDHLAGMLGIEKLDRAIRNVKDASKNLGNQTTFLERQLTESDQIQGMIEELTRRVSRLANEERAAASGSKEMKKTLDAASEKHTRLQALKAVWMRLSAEKDAFSGTRNGLGEQLESLKSEKDNLLARQSELAELKKKLAEYDRLKKEYKEQVEAKNRLELAGELRRQLEELSGDLDNWDKQREAKKTQQDDNSKILQEIAPEIEKRSAEKLNKLERVREQYSETRAQQQSLTTDLSKLEKQLGAISEFGPESICDRCLRPLGEDLPGIKDHLSREQETLTVELTGVQRELEKLRSTGDRLRQESEQLCADERKRSEAVILFEGLKKEIVAIEQNLNSTTGKQDKIKKQLAALGVIGFDVGRFDEIERRLAEMEQLKTELNQLEGSLSRLPVIDRNIASLTAKLKQLQEEIEQKQKQLESLNFDENEASETARELETIRTEWESARTAYLGAVKELEISNKELEGKLERLASFERMAHQLEQTRENRFYSEKLGSLFVQYRGCLISSIRPTLADISSRLVTEMTDGKYSLIELDDKYNLRLLDYGAYFGVERFSGGEKDLANLCLRLAISLALTESAGLSRTFIILDEVFASQDSERRDLIIKSLGGLKNRFPQIILVTHLDEIKDKVECLVEVVPTDRGWSEVIVDGQAG